MLDPHVQKNQGSVGSFLWITPSCCYLFIWWWRRRANFDPHSPWKSIICHCINDLAGKSSDFYLFFLLLAPDLSETLARNAEGEEPRLVKKLNTSKRGTARMAHPSCKHFHFIHSLACACLCVCVRGRECRWWTPLPPSLTHLALRTPGERLRLKNAVLMETISVHWQAGYQIQTLTWSV